MCSIINGEYKTEDINIILTGDKSSHLNILKHSVMCDQYTFLLCSHFVYT